MHCLRSRTNPLLRTMLLMVGRVDENLIVKLFDFIPAKGMSFRQLSYKSGMDRGTVRKYVRLIVEIQNSPRLKLDIDGLRVLVKRERPDSPKARISESLPNQAKMR